MPELVPLGFSLGVSFLGNALGESTPTHFALNLESDAGATIATIAGI